MGFLGKSGASMPGRGLINPAFVIKIIPATDALQQKNSAPRNNPSNDLLDGISVGDEILAKIKGEKITGRVQRIIKNEEGDSIYVSIIDSEGKTRKIEGSRIQKISNNSNINSDQAISSPAMFSESLLSFNEFLMK